MKCKEIAAKAGRLSTGDTVELLSLINIKTKLMRVSGTAYVDDDVIPKKKADIYMHNMLFVRDLRGDF